MNTTSQSADRWLLPGLIAATFLSLVHYLAFSPLLTAIAADMHLDVGELGRMTATIGLGAAVFGLLAGPFADRYGKRRTLLVGLLALVASSLSLAILQNPATLPLIALVAALGRATVYPLALAIAGAEYDGDAQRRAISRVTASLGAAPIVGVPLVTFVAAAYDWRAGWLALAAVTALAYVCISVPLRARTSRPVDASARPTVRQLAIAYGLLVQHRPSLTMLGGTFLLSVGGWAVWTYLGAYVIQQHGFTTQAAGWAWTIVGLGLFAGTILAGGPLGRLRLEALFGAAAIGAGLCLGLAFVVPVSGWLAVIIVGIGTLLHGMTQVVTATLLPRGAPTGRAATMTLRGAASSLGSGAGAALGGLLLSGAGYPALGAVAIICCAGSAALVWWGGTSEVPARQLDVVSPEIVAIDELEHRRPTQERAA